jgi:hypothetical protein
MRAKASDDTAVWIFERGDERIVLRCPMPMRLVVSGHPTVTRTIDFATVIDRVNFQSGFETHLLDTGWTLTAFTPPAPRHWWSRLLRRRPPSRWSPRASA